tara:strand:- start:350 stop:829 length:480 start_codon:yes stop_codon:yes gene_type:complete
MAKQKYLHTNLISTRQTVGWGEVIPGMIIMFDYRKETAFDKQPMILFLWFDKTNDLVHGLNLNYLTSHRLKRLFNIFEIKTEVLTASEENDMKLYEHYTWVKMPGFNKPSKSSVSVSSMKNLYNTEIRKKLLPEQGDNIYRTYKGTNISSLRVLNLRNI